MNLHCQSCDLDVWGIVVPNQSSSQSSNGPTGWKYECPHCQSGLGPLVRDGAVDVSVHVHAPREMPRSVALQGSIQHTASTDPIESLRARLADVECTLANIAPLKAERSYLRRVLAAADRKPRAAT